MAEPTPTELYQDFCDEDALLTASITALESSPALDTLDDLSAAVTRRELVRAQLPTLCAASERYEAGEAAAARLAQYAPVWTTAAAAKTTALSEVSTALASLRTAMAAYEAAHGSQLHVLTMLRYPTDFRTRYAVALTSLRQIVQTVVGGDASWMSRLGTFDGIGCTATLPEEM